MKLRKAETAAERKIRRGLIGRLAFHWAVFFGMVVLLVATLELLYGEPQRPSIDLIRDVFRKHGIVFTAFLVLIPLAMRDTIRCVQRLVERHCPVDREAKGAETPGAAPSTASKTMQDHILTPPAPATNLTM